MNQSCLLFRATKRPTRKRQSEALSSSEAKAFNAGWEAILNGGCELMDNPYPPGTVENCCFLDGALYAKKQSAQERTRRDEELHQKLMSGLYKVDPLAKLEELSIQEVALLIDLPLENWPSNCYCIANKIVKALLNDDCAAAVYGVYYGPVSEECKIFRQGVNRHGWIVMRDGRIVDPTRWVFEASPPAISVFVPGTEEFETEAQHYDEGAEALSGLLAYPRDKESEQVHALPADLGRMLQLLAQFKAGPELRLTGMLSTQQLAWLAKLPYSLLGPKVAHAFYSWLSSKCLEALIPLDYKARMKRELEWGAQCFIPERLD